jgi:hypothetical protein
LAISGHPAFPALILLELMLGDLALIEITTEEKRVCKELLAQPLDGSVGATNSSQ